MGAICLLTGFRVHLRDERGTDKRDESGVNIVSGNDTMFSCRRYTVFSLSILHFCSSAVETTAAV